MDKQLRVFMGGVCWGCCLVESMILVEFLATEGARWEDGITVVSVLGDAGRVHDTRTQGS